MNNKLYRLHAGCPNCLFSGQEIGFEVILIGTECPEHLFKVLEGGKGREYHFLYRSIGKTLLPVIKYSNMTNRSVDSEP